MNFCFAVFVSAVYLSLYEDDRPAFGENIFVRVFLSENAGGVVSAFFRPADFRGRGSAEGETDGGSSQK